MQLHHHQKCMTQSFSGLELGLFHERFIGFRSIVVFAKQNISQSLLCSQLGLFQERFVGTIISFSLPSCPWRLSANAFNSSASFPERAPLAEAAQFHLLYCVPLRLQHDLLPNIGLLAIQQSVLQLLHALSLACSKKISSESAAASPSSEQGSQPPFSRPQRCGKGSATAATNEIQEPILGVVQDVV